MAELPLQSAVWRWTEDQILLLSGPDRRADETATEAAQRSRDPCTVPPRWIEDQILLPNVEIIRRAINETEEPIQDEQE